MTDKGPTKAPRISKKMDTLEFTVPKDDYDTVITVNIKSLSVLVGRTIEPNEWSLVCRRKDCMSCGRDSNGDYKETTFTAHDLHCYMIAFGRRLSKLLWRKLVDSQNVDESFYVSKFGGLEDYHAQVMEDITYDVFNPDPAEKNIDLFKMYWE